MLTPLSKSDREHIKFLLKCLTRKSLSNRKIAQYLRISDSAFSQMLNGSMLPSPRICVLIENKYGIKKEELRPDIFRLN